MRALNAVVPPNDKYKLASISFATLIEDLARLGLRLTVTRFCDGSTRLNCWRTMNYWSNSAAADSFWAQQVGNDQELVEAIKSHLLGAGTYPPKTGGQRS